MGGMVTIVMRDTKKKVYSFKVPTHFMDQKINDINILNENSFFSFLSTYPHLINPSPDNSYSSPYSLRVPFDYGIVLFDFYNQHVFSANNYSGFANTGTLPLCDDYEKMALFSQFMTKHKNSGHPENDTPPLVVDCLEKKEEHIAHLYLLHNALKHNADILVNDVIFNQPYDTMQTFMARLYGCDLLLLSPEEVKRYLYENRALEHSLSMSEYQNVNIVVPDWNFIVGDNSYPFLVEIYRFMQAHGYHLTDDEKDVWESELYQALSQSYDEDD